MARSPPPPFRQRRPGGTERRDERAPRVLGDGAGGRDPFTWSHDRLNGAPEGVPRPTAPEFASPVQATFIWTTKQLVGRGAALNLYIALGFLLTGFAMFLLLSRFGFGLLPSIFGGYVVAFNPWTFERAYAGAPAFLHGWVLVLLLYALVRLRERRTLARAVLAGGAYGLTFAVAAYLGLLATALVIAFAIVDLVRASTLADRLWTASLLAVIGLVTSTRPATRRDRVPGRPVDRHTGADEPVGPARPPRGVAALVPTPFGAPPGLR